MGNQNTKEISKFILSELEKIYFGRKYSFDYYDEKHFSIKIDAESTGKTIFSYLYSVNNKEIFSISSSINDNKFFLERSLNSLFDNNSVNHKNINIILNKYYELMSKFRFLKNIKFKNFEKCINSYNSFLNGNSLKSIKLADVVYHFLPINHSVKSGGLNSKTSPISIQIYLYYNGKHVEPVGLMVLPIASNKKIKCVIPLVYDITDNDINIIMSDFYESLRKYCHSVIAKNANLNRKEQKNLFTESDEDIINQLILYEMINI